MEMIITMVNDSDIKNIFTSYSTKEPKEYFGVYAVNKASFTKVMQLGAFANNFCVIGFNGQEFIIVKLDMSGEPIDGITIPASEIQSIKVSNWFFGMGRAIEIIFKTNDKIKFNVSKYNAFLKNQKSNLEKLESLFSQGCSY